MFEFIMLPNNLFYSSNEEKSIFNKCNNNYKVLSIIEHLYINTSKKDISLFQLRDMIIECGFKPSSKVGETNDQFKDIILKLYKLNIIVPVDKKDIKEFDELINNLKPSSFIRCKLNIDFDKGFMKLYLTEKEKIMSHNKEKINNTQLLFYYCYLKARVYKRKLGESTEGRAEVTWVSYDTIKQDVNLTDNTISNYNDILVALDLIRYDNPGHWYWKGDQSKYKKESPNMYTLFTQDEEIWKEELKQGIKYYKNLHININKVFTDNREYKHNNRQLNGELGSLIKKEKNNTITSEELERKNQIIDIINQEKKDNEIDIINAIIAKIKRSNDYVLLSEYFYKSCNYSLAEKYEGIESELQLLNSNLKLLINYDDYYDLIAEYVENGNVSLDEINRLKNKNNNNHLFNVEIDDLLAASNNETHFTYGAKNNDCEEFSDLPF